MDLKIRRLHPHVGGEVTAPIELRRVSDEASLAEIRAGMDEYAVLVFRDQPFADEEQMAFARRLDGELHAKPGSRAVSKSRLGTEAVADISNVGADGKILPVDDRRRLYSLGNRLWHTDASFESPPGRYSMLSARTVPEGGGPDTQFADMRAAYDALAEDFKATLEGLEVHHSIAHSRQTLGFEFSAEEADMAQTLCPA